MDRGEPIRISDALVIPADEIEFRFSRSSGPGGQHVNRSATRVELLFDVARSRSLTEAQRERLLAKLRSHLDQDGVMHVVSQRTRSQWRNREDAILRFRSLVERALKRRRARRPTRPTKASVERRLEEKRRRSALKRQRGGDENE
ncbi:MAG: aminoacyl-tRNA hydrolase [Acidobacteriota bacterium]|nr:MAG: aminoacyl-tRNA hydrolase [Acidobacteriota bacterium]